MPTPSFQSGFPFSFRSYTGDGSTTVFVIPFPFLAEAHVKVYVNGTLQLAGYTWETSASIQFAVAPEDGASIVVRRETPVNPLVTYFNAASLKASNLNVTAKQNLYLAQEIADVTIGEAILNQDLLDARDEAVAAATAAATARDLASDYRDLAEAAQGAAENARDEAQAVVDALSTTYDISFSVPYLPAAGETVGVFTVNRDLSIPAGALGSLLGCPEAGEQTLTLEFYKNDEEEEFGTATLAAFSLTGAVSIPSAVTLGLSDTVSVKVTSANPNAVPRGFGLTLKATLVNL